VEDALAALTGYGGDARILAGGQSLIPAMRFRLARPTALVDIGGLDELAYVRKADGALVFGATARDATIERDPAVRATSSLIADAGRVVADPVVRQSGTLVGSLCHNDPAGDWPAVALAARASVVVRGPSGTRTLPIDEFIVDSYTTALSGGEMAIEVRFPAASERSAGSYQKIERKVGDFATASAAVQISLTADGTIADAGVAIGALGPTALRVAEAEKLLRGAKPSRDLVRSAAREAEKMADPSPDNRGSVEYKRAMAGVLTARGLVATFERLGVRDLT
jgi:carbon-monoxide dehydrogenase medium subunit